jgi:hypothetical protein
MQNDDTMREVIEPRLLEKELEAAIDAHYGPGKEWRMINLSDPNLAPEHRDHVIMAAKSRIAKLDELIANWYRHRDECRMEECDCGVNDLAEQVSMMCHFLWVIKNRFGETLIGDYPYFDRFLKAGLEPAAYESLTSRRTQ